MLSLLKWLSFAWLACWVIVLGIIALSYTRVLFKRVWK